MRSLARKITRNVPAGPSGLVGFIGGLAIILLLAADLGGKGPVTAPIIEAARATTQNGPTSRVESLLPTHPTKHEVKAYLVLKRHCADCHQRGFRPAGKKSGTAHRQLARSGPTQILDLEKIARDATLVRPGVPDGSPLYNVMVSRTMPPAIKSGSNHKPRTKPGISPRELDDVRTWIASLEPPPPAQPIDNSPNLCSNTHDQFSPHDLRKDIERYIAELTDQRARQTRFVSMAHMINRCKLKKGPDEHSSQRYVSVVRSGLARILNGLSWRKKTIKLVPVDKAGLVLAFDLEDLGWPNERWAWLAGHRATPDKLSARLEAQTLAKMATTVPVVSADWFAHMASTPKFYSGLLALPGSVRALRKRLQKIYGAPGTTLVAGQNAGSQMSHARLVARHTFGNEGFIWESLQPRSKARKSRLLLRPRALFDTLYDPAKTNLRSRKAPPGLREIAVRFFLFRLPNGYIGAMTTDREGYRIDPAGRPDRKPSNGALKPERGADLEHPTARFSKSAQPDAATMACLGCHVQGAIQFADDIGARLGKTQSRKTQAGFQITPWSPNALTTRIQADQFNYARAQWNAGTFAAHSIDPVTELAKSYRADLDLKTAARAAMLDETKFLQTLERYNGPLTATARRLRQGTITRAEFESLMTALDQTPNGGTSTQSTLNPSVSSPPPDKTTTSRQISLWSDKLTYKTGDSLTIFAQPNHNCRLTVFAVDTAGISTILYPNSFARDNLVKSGQTISLPTKDAPYLLKLKKTGRETFVAQCTLPDVDTLPGIDHSFDAQQFTVLGDWTKHLKNAFELEASAYQRGFVPNSKRRRIVRNGRRRRSARRPNWLLPTSAPYITEREAITILIQN